MRTIGVVGQNGIGRDAQQVVHGRGEVGGVVGCVGRVRGQLIGSLGAVVHGLALIRGSE